MGHSLNKPPFGTSDAASCKYKHLVDQTNLVGNGDPERPKEAGLVNVDDAEDDFGARLLHRFVRPLLLHHPRI